MSIVEFADHLNETRLFEINGFFLFLCCFSILKETHLSDINVFFVLQSGIFKRKYAVVQLKRPNHIKPDPGNFCL